MVLLRPSSKIYDPLRKKWVDASPEERVRQKWLQIMTEHLGFPLSLLALERTLEEASLEKESCPFPHRRLDLLCYTNTKEGALAPLLLMEFKAQTLEEGAFEQILRYNTYIHAPFLAVASEGEVLTGFFNPEMKSYQFVSRLPPYQELKDAYITS